MIDLAALFLAVAAVALLWYVVKKAFPETCFFLDLHLCDCSVCVDHLLRSGCRTLRFDSLAGWLAVGLAVNGPIVVTDRRCGNFLCRPNGLAMVGLA
jgi:hypothetical protein